MPTGHTIPAVARTRQRRKSRRRWGVSIHHAARPAAQTSWVSCRRDTQTSALPVPHHQTSQSRTGRSARRCKDPCVGSTQHRAAVPRLAHPHRWVALYAAPPCCARRRSACLASAVGIGPFHARTCSGCGHWPNRCGLTALRWLTSCWVRHRVSCLVHAARGKKRHRATWPASPFPVLVSGCIFHGCLPPNPWEGCHPVHMKPATHST
jgi:hypothetical protein